MRWLTAQPNALNASQEFTLRLFVSEFLCGGGWSGGDRPASLVREGAAMLRAFLRDLLCISQLQVVTTWDRRLAEELGIESPALQVIPVSGTDEEREVFTRLCHDVDGTYVIAPELDDELSQRVSVAICSATERSFAEQKTTLRNWNCSVEAINLCGDKWALYEHFTRCGIPTIPTRRVSCESDESALLWPRVLKLRMGAGSQSMQLVSSREEWERAVLQYDSTNRCTEAIAQPWVHAQSFSVGAIIDRSGAVHVLPVADQFIDPQRGFAYLGGRIPSTVETGSLDSLIRQTLSTIPGLRGYVGVDLLLPYRRGIGFQPVIPPNDYDRQETYPMATPLIVEINPRLTTSYVGYQQLCLNNLAALWIGEEVLPSILSWKSGSVEFSAAGELRCGH